MIDRFGSKTGPGARCLKQVDRWALRSLPTIPYEFAEWTQSKVGIDCHGAADHNFYSTPHRLAGTRVDVRPTAQTVEILHHGRCVASHIRLYGRGFYQTDPNHRPDPNAHSVGLEVLGGHRGRSLGALRRGSDALSLGAASSSESRSLKTTRLR